MRLSYDRVRHIRPSPFQIWLCSIVTTPVVTVYDYTCWSVSRYCRLTELSNSEVSEKRQLTSRSAQCKYGLASSVSNVLELNTMCFTQIKKPVHKPHLILLCMATWLFKEHETHATLMWETDASCCAQCPRDRWAFCKIAQFSQSISSMPTSKSNLQA